MKSNMWFLLSLLLCLWYSALCTAAEGGITRWELAFTKLEVQTREWTNSNKQRIALLEFKVQHFTNHHPIVIAKYGSTITKQVHCIDLYRWHEAARYEPTLELLCHDVEPGTLIELQANEDGERLTFKLLRELHDKGELRRHSYSYTSDENGRLSRSTLDTYSGRNPSKTGGN